MKKLLLMAAGYVGGVVVSNLYNQKKPEELKKELKKSGKEDFGEVKVLWQSFIDTHKTLFTEMEAEVMSEENKKLFEKKKKEILKVASDYKKEADALIKEFQTKGVDFFEETIEELEDLYYGQKDKLESLKDVSPEKVDEMKSNLLVMYKEMKKKIKSMK